MDRNQAHPDPRWMARQAGGPTDDLADGDHFAGMPTDVHPYRIVRWTHPERNIGECDTMGQALDMILDDVSLETRMDEDRIEVIRQNKPDSERMYDVVLYDGPHTITYWIVLL